MTNLKRGHLSRRALLGAGLSGGLALPWLESLASGRRAQAAGTASRFIVFFVPGGRTPETWRPTGGETDFVLQKTLSPLEPYRKQLVAFQGIDAKTYPDGAGANHPNGACGLLTGVPAPSGSYNQRTGFPKARSVDQVIADKISQGRRFKSLELGVLWPTRGTSPDTDTIITYAEPGVPAPPTSDPYAVFQRVFGTSTAPTGGGPAPDQIKAKLVMSALHKEYAALAPRLGGEDRQRLEAHAQRLSEIEKGLQAPAAGGGCTTPKVGPEDALGRYSTITSKPSAPLSADVSARIPALGNLMMDMAVAALACDLTRVVTLQWTDSNSRNTFPWLGLNEHHHFYQHDGGYRPKEMTTIGHWYIQQLAALAGKLASVRDGDGTLLDSTVILYCSELSHPTHDYKDMPFLLLGGAGGAYRGGRFLKYPTPVAHNHLHVSLLRAFGIPAETFGDAKYGRGPLPGLV